MANPNRERVLLLVAAAITVVVIAGCGPAAPQARHDPFFDDDAPSTISGDFDEAEARWRKDIASDRGRDASPEALLTDDPPGDPERYGNVAFKDDPPPPATLWGKVKAGAETVGKVSMAALTVVVTLGAMVAPYLLL